MSIQEILKQYWGYGSFRPLQEDIINSVLSGTDTLALLPTGGGKSICFQVPALSTDGLCLVISPLIALMKDQVENLRRKGITAFAVYSGMSRYDVINTLKVATESNCKFLYVSPERLETNLFLEYLPGMHVTLIAVDEAHCISQWGYDFRPSYLRIAALREQLQGVPVLALTASATPGVQKDICDKLGLPSLSPILNAASAGGSYETYQSWNIFRQSFERPNLSYSVFQVDSKISKLINILKSVAGSAIVYCKSRKRTKEISDILQLQGIAADFYHAGLPQEQRNKKQEEWIDDNTRVIVSTNAFGMGIDKPDVRVVVHADVPDCLENYYQEAGRAGRDGKKAYAVLLYNDKDLEELRGLIGIRFPALEEIRNVYQALGNYLQIPSYSGEGVFYDFDITDFIKKFKLKSNSTFYSLKALEQSEWLNFNEQVFVPPSVQFITNKKRLYEFEESNPLSEPFIKTLLRVYEGIFDYPATISELFLASLLKKDVEEIRRHLLLLHRAGIIEYHPQKDKPQIYLLRHRVKAEDFFINEANHHKRKEQFTKRVQAIIHFIGEMTVCRSRVIGSYFGDDVIKPCGICDNCLRQKEITITKEEFETINNNILTVIQSGPWQTKALLLELKGIKKEKAWKVLKFLQSENKIKVDRNGLITLANPPD